MILCILDDDGEYHEIYDFANENCLTPEEEEETIFYAINDELDKMGYIG